MNAAHDDDRHGDRRQRRRRRGEREADDGTALAHALRTVLGRLDRLASDAGAPGVGARAAEPLEHAPATLDALTTCFGLSAFEREVLLLTAAAELDPGTASRCAAAGGDPDRRHPTFSLALAALPEPHWSALTPVSPLRRWQLVALDDPTRLTTSRLRIDERILHFLVGSPYLDARLHGTLLRVAVPPRLPDSYGRAADRVAAGWTTRRPDAGGRVELVGGDARDRADIAATAADRTGLALYRMAASDLPTDPAERDRFSRLWQREAILLPAALLLEADAREHPEQASAVDAFVAGVGVPLVVSGEAPRGTERPRGRRVTVPPLGEEEQLTLWRAALDGVPGVDDAGLGAVVDQFRLPPHVIEAAAHTVRAELPRDGGEEPAGHPRLAELLWRAGLAEARFGLDELGRRVEPVADWDDLVLPERQFAILREIVAHVRQRSTVYREWGFSRTLRRGLGVTALFAGGSGTGKTLAAETLAGELGLDLFVIDLSQVVSKYIGETEKNLRRVFDAAERGGALLLFDEADALFGKRSEVRDSHDRYANLEVSYLLMRMEAYRGLAVLTTNMKKALDPAFMRRIRFVVDFPFPAEPERAEIWRRVLPPQTPTKGVDPALLAQLTVAGGSIRNIALSAAFLAAEEGDRLQMRHLLAAARTEYLKLERALTPSEVNGWV
ncbi:ATPase family associated with various cellular activities (AAA) [Streptomyces zhaozhouensis]|uniref:ATPase family associated with various cellular activities (AAA) n=1 Tax=Streptomyces zhaozhouensis TaxID=1300267 RepID=A0A286DXS2_9ACTN|nr:ATP-binding protein [Streptomyces zhaozhouensis]SOD63443.1 ATPase family associated with various cellular activities (AAA) [Streptomyces zhaozhouensis]